MKHTKKTALTAAILTAAVSLVSCNNGDSSLQTENVPSDVYEPSSEEIQDVYGPPPYEEEEASSVLTTKIPILPETTAHESAESSDTTTKPIDMQLVYGPPNAID